MEQPWASEIANESVFAGNAKVCVVSKGRAHFVAAFSLAFAHPQATHWKKKDTALILCWSEEQGSVPFPMPMGPRAAMEFAWQWLEQHTADVYGPKPGTDGTTARGWTVERIEDSTRGIVSVQPTWLVYGK